MEDTHNLYQFITTYCTHQHKDTFKKEREKDFSDVKVKVTDSDVASYGDEKNRHHNKFGPYKGIIILAK